MIEKNSRAFEGTELAAAVVSGIAVSMAKNRLGCLPGNCGVLRCGRTPLRAVAQAQKTLRRELLQQGR